MNNRILYIVLFMLSVFHMAYSQNIGFHYDDAGNCISREIIVLSKAPKGKAATSVEPMRIAEKDILINQTDGKLRIEVSGYDATDNFACSIFNYSDHEIMSAHPRSSSANLYTESLPTGVYILRVSLNGEKMSRKIIKK